MFATLMRVMGSLLLLAGVSGGLKPGADGMAQTLAPSACPRLGYPSPPAAAGPESDARTGPARLYRVYRVTAYCDRGLTASGLPSGVGQCAAPADIPFGARVYIPALDRAFVVTDRTAKRFRHNTVDLFIPDRQECLKFGRQYLECEITFPSQTVRYGSRRLYAAVAAVGRDAFR